MVKFDCFAVLERCLSAVLRWENGVSFVSTELFVVQLSITSAFQFQWMWIGLRTREPSLTERLASALFRAPFPIPRFSPSDVPLFCEQLDMGLGSRVRLILCFPRYVSWCSIELPMSGGVCFLVTNSDGLLSGWIKFCKPFWFSSITNKHVVRKWTSGIERSL